MRRGRQSSAFTAARRGVHPLVASSAGARTGKQGVSPTVTAKKNMERAAGREASASQGELWDITTSNKVRCAAKERSSTAEQNHRS